LKNAVAVALALPPPPPAFHPHPLFNLSRHPSSSLAPHTTSDTVYYIVTGAWSRTAYEEVAKFGSIILLLSSAVV
jgi:hypothetical protein